MKINGTFIAREIAGELMLVPTGSTAESLNGMITLNDTAMFIWNHIEAADSLEALIDLVCEEFEVDRDTAAKDTFSYLRMLNENGFIVPTREDRTW